MKTPANSAAEMVQQLSLENEQLQQNIDDTNQNVLRMRETAANHVVYCEQKIATNAEVIATLEPVAEWTDA
jgi:hypothetical protein